MNKARHADIILTHYITLALKYAGAHVNDDTYQELTGLIEDAINEAVDRAVREALQSIPSNVLE